MKIIVISFADSRFEDSLNRLKLQCARHPNISCFFGYTQNTLPKSILRKIKNRLKQNRGYGYWIWKPFLIDYHLSRLGPEEILLYVDAGCNIIYNKKSKIGIKFLCSLAYKDENNGLVVFQKPLDKEDGSMPGYYQEYKWTKEDLFHYFKIDKRSKYRLTPQVISGAMILRKNNITSSLISDWKQIMYSFPNLVDDSVSQLTNSQEFIENRHDQSVFSLLVKRLDIKFLPTKIIEGYPAIFGGGEILAVRDINNRMRYKNLTQFKLALAIKKPIRAVIIMLQS